MIEYIYLFIGMHNVKLSPVCLSVILSCLITRLQYSSGTCVMQIWCRSVLNKHLACRLLKWTIMQLLSKRLPSCLYQHYLLSVMFVFILAVFAFWRYFVSIRISVYKVQFLFSIDSSAD